MLKYIKQTDIFGDNISFKINNYDSSKTLVGGFFTIILYSISFIFLFFEAKDAFLKLNPILSSYTNVKQQRDQIELKNTTIPFAFGLIDDNNTNYNNLVKFYISENKVDFKNGKADTISIKMHPFSQCRLYHFPEITQNEFDSYNLSNYYCIDDLNITLSGYWSEKSLSFVEIDVKLCGNDDSEEKCLSNKNSLDEARKKNRNVFLSIYFQNNILNTKNYKNYTTPFSDVIVLRLEPDFFKFAQVFLRKQTLVTDDGLIFENESKKDIYSLDYYYSDFSLRTDSLIFKVNLHPSGKSYEERRVYNKIQSALANTGAIFDYLRVIPGLFCGIFGTTKMNLTIMNKLFEFDLFNINNGKGNILNLKKISNEMIKKDLTIGINDNNNIDRSSYSLSHSPSIYVKKRKKNSEINDVSNINNNEIKTMRSDQKIFDDKINVDNNRYKYVYAYIRKDKIIRDDNQLKRQESIKRKFSDDFISSKDRSIELSSSDYTEKNHNSNKNSHHMNPVINKEKDNNLNLNKIRNKNLVNRKLQFSLFEIIKTNLFCCFIRDKSLKKKHALYDVGLNKLEKMFDICYLMNKLEEIEKMKFVLFDKKQLSLFNLSSREVCSLSISKANMNYFNKMKLFECNEDNHKNTLKEFKERSLSTPDKLDDLDKRLLDLLSSDVREYLEYNKLFNV